MTITAPPTNVPQSVDARIKRIYDHLYGNAAIRTPSAIASEVGKLIRTAVYMENGTTLFPAFSFGADTRMAVTRGDETACRRVADEVRGKFAEMNAEWQFYADDRIALSDYDLAWCCCQLEGIAVSGNGRDIFGDAVEIFRTSWAKQSSGQFFTDPRVTQLAMTLLRFNVFTGDDLVDISCGTGGFLLAGLNHIHALAENQPLEPVPEDEIANIARAALKGQEIDPEISEIANASLACRVGRSDVDLVQRGDSIDPSAFTGASGAPIVEGTHLCAATNPPFGTKITVKDPNVLKYYELARSTNNRTTPRAPDILLLERNVRLLKPGQGRLAIVIPYQILSGPQTRFIREWLLRHTHVESVVDLPAETFQPHTGTKTALLVVRRRSAPLAEVPTSEVGEVFMSVPRWIGHDRRGQTIYRSSSEVFAADTVLSDMEDVGEAFEAFREGAEPSVVHGESFVISLDRILSDSDLRLNARYYAYSDSIQLSLKTRNDWTMVRLGELCERIFFPGRFKRNYVDPSEVSVPFLGGSEISDLLPETKKHVSKDDPRTADLLVRQGWLLVTRSGTTGIVSSVPLAWDGVAVSEHVIRIVPREDTVPAAWLHAYLRSKPGQRALARGVFGSVIDEITPEFIANLEVPIPNDAQLLQTVVGHIQRAERARQQSMREFEEALNPLNVL